MTKPIREPKWLAVRNTKLPELPTQSRLVVEDVSPDKFDVTCQSKGNTALLSMAAERRPRRILLTIETVFVFEDDAAKPDRQCDVDSSSRFKVERIEVSDDDDLEFQLLLTGGKEDFLVVKEGQLDEVVIKWLESRFNEWLGWEFPTHCVACGRRLQACDVEWPERSVDCSECDYRGPAPDPFEPDSVPSAPRSSCPNCDQAIWLTSVNRRSGGCHCDGCGWFSEATPPLASFAVLWEVALAHAFNQPEMLIPEEEVRAEFPRVQDAVTTLEGAGFVSSNERSELIIVFSRWKNLGVRITATMLSLIFLSTLGYLMTRLSDGAELQAWGALWILGIVAAIWLFDMVALGFLISWAGRRVTLSFTPVTLCWQIGEKKRQIRWETLSSVAVAKGGWLPSVLLKHGGAGLNLIIPTHATARAIARLCLERIRR